jgi:putative ABC transport system permease protein
VVDQSVTDFGGSEISGETILIPYSVARYFTDSDEVKQIYFSMHNMAEVPAGADTIRRIVSARHNPKFIYATQDLDHVMHLAAKISNIVTIILILIAAVTLIVGGVGIMNIMLANVGDRVDEIGLRKALGATQREIKMQFISEAVFISLSGGLVGCVLGLALPLSVRWFSGLELPVSLWSVVIGLAAACLTGVVFGTVPAARAAELDPVESMRYEL